MTQDFSGQEQADAGGNRNGSIRVAQIVYPETINPRPPTNPSPNLLNIHEMGTLALPDDDMRIALEVR
jgi:hypothetical protein